MEQMRKLSPCPHVSHHARERSAEFSAEHYSNGRTPSYTSRTYSLDIPDPTHHDGTSLSFRTSSKCVRSRQLRLSQDMTETENTPGTECAITSNHKGRTEPVTAARRSSNLDTIRKQPGWEDFPECLPLAMRTTKSGKITDFGNTKLRIIERIALNADFRSAISCLESLTRDGNRLLSLKDLEACAARFDQPIKSSSKRGSISSSAGPSQGDDDEQKQQLAQDAMGSWSHVCPPESSRLHHTDLPPKRSIDETFVNMSTDLTTSSKRQRTDTFFESTDIGLLFPMSDDVMNMCMPDFTNQNSLLMKDVSCFTPVSQQDPTRVLLSLHPHAGTIFSSLDRAFDELLSKAQDQRQLVSAALDQLRSASTGLSVPVSQATELGSGLVAAQRIEANARRDLEQARSARDIIEMQYGHIETSLSRALLGTVRDEHTMAEAKVKRAMEEVGRVKQELDMANNHEAALQRTKEVAALNIDQLQRQTKLWLKRLAEVGVKFSDQLSTMQNGLVAATNS